MTGQRIGYVRVSTHDQIMARQLVSLVGPKFRACPIAYKSKSLVRPVHHRPNFAEAAEPQANNGPTHLAQKLVAELVLDEFVPMGEFRVDFHSNFGALDEDVRGQHGVVIPRRFVPALDSRAAFVELQPSVEEFLPDSSSILDVLGFFDMTTAPISYLALRTTNTPE